MILAHLSDLHLGYRAYDRTDRGRNVRERDVATVFQRAVQEITTHQPDLVVVAGDVFDRPDPSPGALVALTRGLERLRAALPDTPVLLVAGARDTPRRPGDTAALTALDAFPGVEAATRTARSVHLLDRSIHACLVPYRATLREPFPVPEPDPRARWNLVVAYGGATTGARSGVAVDPDAWDYLALGSAHVHRQVAPNAWYAGSLERVGPAPWREAVEEKGFLLHDLSRGSTVFHPMGGRPVVALAPTRVPAGDPEGLRERVREVTDEVPGGIDGKIVHVTLRGIPSRELLTLQGEFLASLRRRALHFSMEVEEEVRPRGSARVDLEARLRNALEGAGVGSLRKLAELGRTLGRGGAHSPGRDADGGGS